MQSRRTFLRTLMLGGAVLAIDSTPFGAFMSKDLIKITILHTNDTHSHIDPFPDNDPKYPGLGGFARRAAIIKKIRKQESNVLVFDAGDVCQGSPYFNFYKGEVEFKLMSEMGYDAMTFGNHEFDNGIDSLVSQISNMNFPIVNSNYDLSNSILNDKVSKYKIFEKQGIKIGVFGLGVKLNGLVNDKNFGGIKYLDPYEKAAEAAYKLKKELKCDLIICLSHMGLSYTDDTPSDINLAKQSKNIDLIIGGHTHTFIDKPYIFKNSDRKDVLVAQVGWAGVKLGKIDFFLVKGTDYKFANSESIKINKKNV
jgi:5'-nucleotidase